MRPMLSASLFPSRVWLRNKGTAKRDQVSSNISQQTEIKNEKAFNSTLYVYFKHVYLCAIYTDRCMYMMMYYNQYFKFY